MLQRICNREFAYVTAFIKPRKWTYILSTLAAAVVRIWPNFVLALIMRDMLNAVARQENTLAIRAVIIAVGTLPVWLPAYCLSEYVKKRCVRQLMTEIRVKVFRHLEALPVSSFEHRHSGDLISRCTNDLQTQEGIFLDQIPSLIYAVVAGLGSLIFIFILEWRIGFLVFSMGIITTLVNTVLAKPMRRASDRVQSCLGALTERLTDLLHSLPVTKMFLLEPKIHRLYAQANEEVSAVTIKQARIEALSQTSNIALLFWLRDIGFLAVGLFMLMKGFIELGTIPAVVLLQRFVNEYMFRETGRLIADVQRSLASVARVSELLGSPIELERHPYPTDNESQSIQFLEQDELPRPQIGDVGAASTGKFGSTKFLSECENAVIEIRNVNFTYQADQVESQSDDTKILQDISLLALQGQIVALVGPSGGGKSTILKLLLGFYPIGGGTISINGKLIEQYSLTRLREIMAYVSQEAYLFDGTIEENIRYGNPEATRDEIMNASKAANAHDFIMAQPDTYDTLVGERGVKLSGGERQRIAIARALLKDSPILLLDEATSALDSESEQLVQDALSVLMSGRTTMAIAHRLSTIQNAEAIYVIDGGKVVEQGTHDELVTKRGLYSKLYKLQFMDKDFITRA
jgi:ABC-type multidrug transport system fused ATPase/permease subunit